MTIQQMPLIKGTGKNFQDADYIDAIPVNVLAVPKPILNANGYMRSFPGIDKLADVAGTSRGVQYNVHESAVYRVMGGKLYKGTTEVGDVSGSERVSMACSINSQAVAASGKMTLYRYDGTVKTLDNWPAEVVEKEGYERDVKEWDHKAGNTDYILLKEDDLPGEITITITPTTSAGVTGEPFVIRESQWGLQLSQENPGGGKPYITALVVKGNKIKGGKVTLEYTFHGTGDVSHFTKSVAAALFFDGTRAPWPFIS